jgi:hypothetical protein
MYAKTIGVIALAALALVVAGTTITVQHVFAAAFSSEVRFGNSKL